VGISGIAASWVVTRYHGISHRHGNVTATGFFLKMAGGPFAGPAGLRCSATAFRYNEGRYRSMPNTAKMIELPPDLQAFAEERVRAGKSGSVDDVVRDALEQKKLSVLREALDVGIAELDAGLGVDTTPDELMAEVSAELGLDE
jgi:Arc/MetJ-type ribon-helix-helix transcriptional regulator